MSSNVDEAVESAADAAVVDDAVEATADAAVSETAGDTAEVANATADASAGTDAVSSAAKTSAPSTGTPDPDEIVGTATDAADEAANTADEAANTAGDAANDAATDAGNAAGEAAGQATEATGQASGSGGGGGGGGGGGSPGADAGQAVTQASETAQAQVNQVSSAAQGAAGTSGDAGAAASSLAADGGGAVANGRKGLGKAGDAAQSLVSPEVATAAPQNALASSPRLQADSPASWTPSDVVLSDPTPLDAVAPATADQGGSVLGSPGFDPGALIDAVAGSPLAGQAGPASAAAAITLAGVAAWRFGPMVSSYSGCYVPGAFGAAGSTVRGLLSGRLAGAGTPAAAAAREALVLGARTVGSGSLGALSSLMDGAARLRLPAIAGTLGAPGSFSALRFARVALIALSVALVAAAALPSRVMRLAGLTSIPTTYRSYALVAGLLLLVGAAIAGAMS